MLRLTKWLPYAVPAVALISLLALAPAGYTQAKALPANDLQQTIEQTYAEIQALKATGAEIPQELYDRYFQADLQLDPQRDSRGRDGDHLDQGLEACPGYPIVQPLNGDLTFTDYGQTYNNYNDCGLPQCRPGRDVIFAMDLNHPAWLEISTCGSGFDTWICVYQDSCCRPAAVPIFSNDDNPALCGRYTLQSAISACFSTAGRYYIVIDGYGTTAMGHYGLHVRTVADSSCNPIIIPDCPPNYFTHEETGHDLVCSHSVQVECEQGYCGIIEPLGDLDIYSFSLDHCTTVELSVYANATPGRSGYTRGLNPIGRLFPGMSCDHELFRNDDFNGSGDAPFGQDSRLVAPCLRPGTYFFEIAGVSGSTGPYEFTIHCIDNCPAQAPAGPLTINHASDNTYCVSWPSQPATTVYYIWRIMGGTPTLAGTTSTTEFCETVPGGSPSYMVFTGPCGLPPEIPAR